MSQPLERTLSEGDREAMRAHNESFENCVEKPPGSGNFILPFRKKLLYAWPSLGYYMMRCVPAQPLLSLH